MLDNDRRSQCRAVVFHYLGKNACFKLEAGDTRDRVRAGCCQPCFKPALRHAEATLTCPRPSWHLPTRQIAIRLLNCELAVYGRGEPYECPDDVEVQSCTNITVMSSEGARPGRRRCSRVRPRAFPASYQSATRPQTLQTSTASAATWRTSASRPWTPSRATPSTIL